MLQTRAGASTQKAPAAETISLLISIFIAMSCCASCVKPADKTEIFSSGRKFYEERSYIQAEKKLEQALKLFAEQEGTSGPNIGSVEMFLGNTKWELGKYKDALAQHKAAAVALTAQHGAESELVADAELRLGIDSISLNDKKAAKQHFEKALRVYKMNLPKAAAKVKQLQLKLKALAANK